ncbi:hypothetical protein Mal4_57450 [Maioricimonas rarisocia]|uniref:Uncharacterized protein n=1 Tax=Maioricimonas rarisocia TaxID=2528026 RepID=A0A517ZFW9_9PLAN|nr:hypothetical protein [Maioricimonas rarisocia]QDU41378.1 hypothetical protein Mal4_57450 [Maioricimonas rarisocia]
MQRIPTPVTTHSRQGGAVIIVVVSLMAALAFLGFFFFTFADQEQSNARNYANAESYAIDPDPVFDFALQQYIVSTPDGLENSALYAEQSSTPVSKWSLLANLLGTMRADGQPTDIHPHSGVGINFMNVMSTSFELDYDGDGTMDATDANYRVNFSAAANRTTPGTAPDLVADNMAFDPDAGYTYPDINSPFLALDQIDKDSGDRLIKPSFMLPGLFNPGDFATLYTDGTRREQVFRPHQSHVNAGAAGTPRFLNSPTQAQSGDRTRFIEPMDFALTAIGLWDGSGSTYDLDVDADNDGVTDAILMDLDHPIIDLPDGRQVVPLFAPKIIDAQALLNVNVHGNLNEILWNGSLSFTHPVGGGESAHASNLGLSPAEVNPTWALAALPNDNNFLDSNDIPYAMREHETNFGISANAYYTGGATNRAKRMATANMELAFLLCGRAQRDGGPQIAGRWTDAGTSVDFSTDTVPGPGETGVDDDLDSIAERGNPGRNAYGGYPFTSQLLNSVVVPPYVHPLDFLGIGGGYLNDTAGGATRVRNSAITGNPARWLTYGDSWQDQSNFTVHGVTTYQNAAPSASPLPQAAFVQGLTDEDDEVVVEPAFPQSDDAIFNPQEMAGLHLSEADWHGVGMNSRLRKLLPFNFEHNKQAATVRSQFTTDSWSRLEFAQGPGARGWEFNDNDGTNFRFPPKFSGVNASRHETATTVVADPFRPVVRRLLTVRVDNNSTDRNFPQQRLDINRLLVQFDPYGNPIYRHLTPHPVFDGTENDSNQYLVDGSNVARNMVHDNPTYSRNYYEPNVDPLSVMEPDIPMTGTYAAVPFSAIASDKFAQEMWARYDRQRLARDIYVLLYVLGSDGTFDPTTTAYPVNATTDVDGNGIHDHLERAAQFAVNYVDAVDRDSVITRFEYDTNLTDGWNNATEVANGVEEQKVFFSEVMMLQTEEQSNDLTGTLHDDGTDGHRFLYVELRNNSGFPVDLKDGTYRLVREDGGSEVASVEFVAKAAGDHKSIPPGETFMIGCHDGTVTNASGALIASDFYADIVNSDELEAVIPNATRTLPRGSIGSEDPDPLCDLDLAVSGRAAPFDHENYVNTSFIAGGTLVAREIGGGVGATPILFDLVLQRRRNNEAAGIGENEWIEIDRFTLDSSTWTGSNANIFDPEDGNNQSDFVDELQNTGSDSDGIVSVERPQPFNPSNTVHGNTATRNHTLEPRETDGGDKNRKNDALSGTAFTLWQPHFDRDFSSIYELLAVPIISPTDLKDTLRDSVSGQMSGYADSSATPKEPFAASYYFLNPDSTTPGDVSDDNAWYRLFEFLTTTQRTHQAIAPVHDSPAGATRPELRISRRTPGKVNLNMIRHETVLAGLIDDEFHLDPFGNTNPTDDEKDASRNWFDEMRRVRDGEDGGGNIRLPGTPFAQPFRPLSFEDPTATTTTLNHSILRDHAGVDLGLFEARAQADIGVDNIDYHTRHRLLAKIANNSTLSSDVFAMWLVVQFHEAHETSAGAVQIGAKARGLPVYRLFCVIDRSRLEEAFDPDSGTFDFRKFIIHRQLLP